jgi:hypothetical protein
MNIEHGEKLFEFRSKADWIKNASSAWKSIGERVIGTVCVDQRGRMCAWGEHFSSAERDNAYPIEVFRLRKDMAPESVNYPDKEN